MKVLLTITTILLFSQAFSQLAEVKFRELTFDNGMLYPAVVIPENKAYEDAINKDLMAGIADLKESDFCIGQYGYVQKSTHLQIHIFCNCIDLDESENRFFLYNIENGTAVPYSDLLNPTKLGDAGSYLADRTRTYLESLSSQISKTEENTIMETNFDAFKTEMTRDGVNLWLTDNAQWGKDPLFISWTDLRSFLRLHFI